MFRWLKLKMFRTARVEATGTASALLLIPQDPYGLALPGPYFLNCSGSLRVMNRLETFFEPPPSVVMHIDQEVRRCDV